MYPGIEHSGFILTRPKITGIPAGKILYLTVRQNERKSAAYSCLAFHQDLPTMFIYKFLA